MSTIIMRADNKGEGGSLALLALINRTISGKKKWASGIVMLGVFATALFYGDSMITPAVIGAVGGRGPDDGPARASQPFVIPAAVAILVGLFAIQARGTARVGLMFGPDHAGLFRRARRAWRHAHHGPAERHPGDDQPAERGRILHRPSPFAPSSRWARSFSR